MNQLSNQQILTECEGAFQMARESKARGSKALSALSGFGITKIIRDVGAPIGECFICFKKIPIKKGQALITVSRTCSPKCRSELIRLQKPRDSENFIYGCMRCLKQYSQGFSKQRRKTNFCLKCLNELKILKRRPDPENVGKCLDCGIPIARLAYRCRLCVAKKKRATPKQIRQRKFAKNVRDRIRQALLKRKDKHTEEYLGCSMLELRKHLEKQFQDGMSWENYGLYGWHIDHIKPICSFDLDVEEERHKAFHHTNLQPLWAYDNLSKGKKIL